MRVLIAIDFGTARSGYAFAYADEREVLCRVDWPDQPVPYLKTLSQMLYGPGDELIAWGYSAPKQLALRRRTGEPNPYRLVRAFKMKIKEGRPTPRGPAFVQDDRSYYVLDLIVDYLRQLKDMVLTELQGGGTGLLHDRDVRWCLTVPAIWNDADKQLMRTAAREAGLIGPGDAEADRLELVLEPEAAALYCQEKDGDIGASRLKIGTRFMVIDAGGGTVDLTVHEVARDGLREVVPGSGGPCGSTYIDEQFLKHIETVLGPYVYRRFREDEPIAFQKLLEDWERAKCDFKGSETYPTLLPITRQLGRILDEPDHRVVLHQLAAQQGGDEDNLHLSPATMHALFRPVLDNVVRAVEQQFRQLGGERCDYIFLVGGFAASPALQKRLREAFAARVQKIIVPPEPGRAVLHGAVLYGLDRTRIRSRGVRRTYGCDTYLVFEPGKDPEPKKVWNADRQRFDCKDRFSVFVTAGQVIESDQKVTNLYYPTLKNQTQMKFNFYSTPQTSVRYVDEGHVKRIGELTVDLPNPSGDLNRTVELTMYFGRTEVRVEAIDRASGRTARTTLHFTHE